MPRAALPLVVALLVLLGDDQASAARTTVPLRGVVRALALSGNAVVVARQPTGKGLVVERVAPGAPTQILLSTTLDDENDQVALSASADAVAVALNATSRDNDFGSSRVLIGPAAGPLREVWVCTAGLVTSPVAVNGSRIGWREGGCGEPSGDPRGVTPSVLAIGSADPDAAVRKIPVPGQSLPGSLALGPNDTGVVGMLLPSFFRLDSEIRSFSPAGVGAPILSEPGLALTVIGILADGTRVLLLSGPEDDKGCGNQLFTLAPGATERKPVDIGGCVSSTPAPGPVDGTGPVANAGGIVGLVAVPSGDGTVDSASVVSVREGQRRVVARGTYRVPLGVAADGARVGWWQQRCSSGSEVVVQDAADPSVAAVGSCSARILTRAARVRGGRIAVRVRCPLGCHGFAFAGRPQAPAEFQFGRGTHTVRLPFSLGKRRSVRTAVRLIIENGPSRSATVRVHR
jgi:hypothetical protein